MLNNYRNFYIGEGDSYVLNFDDQSFFGDAGKNEFNKRSKINSFI